MARGGTGDGKEIRRLGEVSWRRRREHAEARKDSHTTPRGERQATERTEGGLGFQCRQENHSDGHEKRDLAHQPPVAFGVPPLPCGKLATLCR